MHKMVYNDINRSKIVYPTGQGQTGFKPGSSPWPPDYLVCRIGSRSVESGMSGIKMFDKREVPWLLT